MLSGVLCRAVTTILGFVWPAYQCFKDVEHKKNNHKQWCIYWIVIVLYSALERFSDLFLFWIPLYSETKIGLVYFLACANGADYVYTRTVAPLLKDNEAQIDDKIAKGQAWVQSHISANVSKFGAFVQDKMLGAISLLHSFQKDHQALQGNGTAPAPPGPTAAQAQWQIPAGQAPVPQSDTSGRSASRRLFGKGR